MYRAVCILILSLTTIHAWSKDRQKSPIPSHEMQFVETVELQVKNNDTFYLARMHDIYVYPKIKFRNKQQQGQMLMKLMDRESHRTSYEIIKQYRGKASANFWQFIAKLFKNDLKEGYDAEDKDRIIERVINLVEAGQL